MLASINESLTNQSVSATHTTSMTSGSKDDVELLSHLLDSITLEPNPAENGKTNQNTTSDPPESKNGQSPRHVLPSSHSSRSSGLSPNRPQLPTWRTPSKTTSSVGKFKYLEQMLPCCCFLGLYHSFHEFFTISQSISRSRHALCPRQHTIPLLPHP